MTDLFKVRIRKVGTSLGVLIPFERLKEADLVEGDEVELALLSHKKDFSGFGIARDYTISFVRDKKVRDFR